MGERDMLLSVRRIVCLGDSITHEGDAPGGYVTLLREALNAKYPQNGIEVIGAGIGGHRSSDMRLRFSRDVLAHRPDIVTISCGINDVWHGFDAFHPDGDGPKRVPLPEFRKNVQAMVEAAQAERVQPIVLSTTVIEEDANSKGNVLLRDYNAVLEHVAKFCGCRFVDLVHPFLDEIARHRLETGQRDLWLTRDGVHLTSRGNALFAEVLLEGITN